MDLHVHNREKLLHALRSCLASSSRPAAGFVLLQGGEEKTRYCTDHVELFRQESYFAYLFGVKEPGFYGAIDVASGKSFLFVPRLPAEYAIWFGELKPLSCFKETYMVDMIFYTDEIAEMLHEHSGGLEKPLLFLLYGLNTDSDNFSKPADFQDIEKFDTDLTTLHPVLTECRIYKSQMELAIIQYANDISSEAHIEDTSSDQWIYKMSISRLLPGLVSSHLQNWSAAKSQGTKYMDEHHTNSLPLFSSPPSPLLCNSNWAHHCHGKVEERREESIMEEELRQALLYATIELESTRAVAQEQLMRMEGEVANLRALLDTTVRERDEARQQCHHAVVLLHNTHQQRQDKLSENVVHNIHPHHENGISAAVSASSEESSIVSSPPLPPLPPTRATATETATEEDLELGSILSASKKELPEKGRLLEAVMKAGPLLQNLLLAGPLPQWRHPPPPLRSFEIPPVSIGTANLNTPTTVGIKREGNKKRKEREGDFGAFSQSSPSSSWSPSSNSNTNVKNQRNGPPLEAVDYY